MSIISAGEAPVMNVFKTGVVLVLISEASGKTLRITEDGNVDGKGEEEENAQFKVNVRGPERVSLQNVNDPNSWLRVFDNKLDGKGLPPAATDDDPVTDSRLKLEQHSHHVVLESVLSPGQHVGFHEDGEPVEPKHAFTGKHAQFQPKVIDEVKEIITAGTSPHENLLAHGNVVVLESVASGKSLRVYDDGRIDGIGESGALAQFISHVVGDNTIKLQCMKNRKRWLNIDDNDRLNVGLGGIISEFKVDNNDGYLVLESVNFPGSHIGVKDNGTIQFPSKTGKGKDAQFKVQVIMEQPEYHRVGTSLLERTLHHGNEVVLLLSHTSNKTLQINENMIVDGSGEEGAHASWFIVHVRAPGVVALQNKMQPDLYLHAEPDQLTTAPGGSRCNFKVKDNGDHLLFESEDNPGMYVGIQPDGNVKPPKDTDEGEGAQFSPMVKKDSPYSRPQ